jgi:hypothetical protein
MNKLLVTGSNIAMVSASLPFDLFRLGGKQLRHGNGRHHCQVIRFINFATARQFWGLRIHRHVTPVWRSCF